MKHLHLNRHHLHLIFQLLTLFILCITHTECKISYSLSGASIPPEAKTYSVQFFPNRSPLVNPNLSTEFDLKMKERFDSQTSLNLLVNEEGDLNFDGQITDYKIKPIAITTTETASQNRLTITIRVKFTNQYDPESDFDTSFSAFEDYENSQQFESIEEELVNSILDQIVQDIFNKSVVNW